MVAHGELLLYVWMRELGDGVVWEMTLQRFACSG
jgi:hypothetical protein